MQICPHCASDNIYYSKKKNRYICEDCDKGFEQPAAEKGMRVFISYGHDDNQWLVNKIKDYLVEKGYDVWIDSSNIPKGADWRERITDGLSASNGVLAFLSKHSVRNPGVCLDELRIALRLRHSYVKSILLEDYEEVRPPYRLSDRQWIDMVNWRDVPPELWDEYFRSKMDELIAVLESDDAKKYDTEMTSISQALKVNITISKQQKLLREEFVGRQWLAEEVQNWLENDNRSRMLIYGVPGSGKSAFAANFSNFSVDVVAEMFFEWDNQTSADTDTVIRQLAYHLAGSLPDYRRMLCDLIANDKNNEKRLETLHNAALFDWLILDPITCCIDGNRDKALVIIDGLDETTDEIAHLLFNKAAAFPEWIRFLFTSRYDETAVAYYASARTVMLDSNDEKNGADIMEYVAHRLGYGKDSAAVLAVKEKSEGSFMYAKTLCDAVQNEQFSLSDTSGLPDGLNDFYHAFFDRLFPEYESFVKIRPFFELLCIENEVSELSFCIALGLDKYGLWEMRSRLKSMVISEKTSARGTDHKILRFIHKSIADWLQCQEYAGRYYINAVNGYKLLAAVCERLDADREQTLEVISDIADDSASQSQINALKGNYHFWLVKGKRYDTYRKLLMDSFDTGKMNERIGELVRNYVYYYQLYDLWKWADLLPESQPVADLKEKLTEIVTFPYSLMCSEFSHRSFQISLFLLSDLMETGRFAEVFFTFMGQFSFSGYFMSCASDMDGETRDGWDKFYMAKFAAICLKKLDKRGVTVPDHVRRECERMKLTYNFYMGKNDGMFSLKWSEACDMWHFGILYHDEMYKDICVYTPENALMTELKTNYNTQSLCFFLIYGEDEDDSFVRACQENLADVKAAFAYAAKILSNQTTSGKTIRNKAKRLAYVKTLTDTFLTK